VLQYSLKPRELWPGSPTGPKSCDPRPPETGNKCLAPLPHLYVVRVQNRDEVLAKLNAEGIGAGIHYPVPLHLHGALQDLGYREGDFPEAERAAQEILSLPMYPHITEAQQQRVAEVLRKSL